MRATSTTPIDRRGSPADRAEPGPRTTDGAPTARKRIEEVLPLTPLQEGLLFHALYDAASPDVYTGQLVLGLEGPLDVGALHQAVRWLLQRHATLRACFRHASRNRPMQIIVRDVPAPWTEIDLSALSPAEQPQQLAACLEDERLRRFDTRTAPLLRVTLVRLADARFRLALTWHHMLIDGWSIPILTRELFTRYRSADEAAALPPVAPYRDYLAWMARQDRDAARRAWQTALADLDRGTRVAPETRTRAAAVPAMVGCDLPESLTRALTARARDGGWTLNTVVHGAWAMVLAQMAASTDVVFGTTVAGRPPDVPGVDAMIGLFINTVPVRVRLSPSARLDEVLTALQRQQADLLAYHHLGMTELQRLADAGPLFDTLMVVENYPIAPETPKGRRADLRVTSHEGYDSAHYPLCIAVVPGSPWRMRLTYQTGVFDRPTIEALAARIERALAAIAADPSQRVASVSLLGDHLRAQLLSDGTGAERPLADRTLAEIVETRAAQTPQAVAAIDDAEPLTYASLNARANRLAHALIALGVGPDDAVVVLLPRSVDSIVALLGIWKAGAVYVPLDVETPAARVMSIVGDVAPRAVVTTVPTALTLGSIPTLDPRAMPEASTPNPTDGERGWRLQPAQAAYIIHTSGSTGTPKGVRVSHRALLNTLQDLCASIGFGPADRIAALASPAFDISLLEMAGPWLTGGSTRVLPALEALELDRLRDVTIVHAVPSLMQPLVKAMAESPARTHVRCLLTGGDRIPPPLLRDMAAVVPAESIRVFYGPTEAAIICAGAVPDLATTGAPMGRPLANMQLLVLDEGLQPVPAGVAGELYIGGAGLACGYDRRPALTAARFVAHPFATGGARLYRTGDLARWRADGQLEFVGRSDRQIKIRGHRVELGELEAALRAQPGVADAVAIARDTAAGDRRLIAYVIGTDSIALDAAALRSSLADTLPDYVVPSAVVPLARFPTTRNGKIDRTALPEPESASQTAYRAPRTADEAQLCLLFAEVLGNERVGIDDDFFQSGGDSLLAIQLLGCIRTTFDVDLSIRSLFEAPTVAGLVATALGGRVSEASADPFATALPLRSSGDLPPLFCVHPAGGVSWCYTSLLGHIGTDRPVYGIQARGLETACALPETMREMVAEYAEQIRRIQPEGPYHLLGFSLGGVFAHAVAVRLQEIGQTVAFLALVDAVPFRHDVQAVAPKNAVRLDRLRRLFKELSVPSDVDANVERIWHNCVRLASGAPPERFDGNALIVAGVDPQHGAAGPAPADLWAPLISGDIRTVSIAATHDEILKRAGDTIQRALAELARAPVAPPPTLQLS